MEDLIIIIPTYNRHHYLGRVVKYYSSFPCKVYICDSSNSMARIESKGNIIYRWDPKSNFYGKVLDVVNSTSAEYYALSADDDFLKEETLLECYSFLRDNPDYSVGTGKQVLFEDGFKEGFHLNETMNQLHRLQGMHFPGKRAYVRYFWLHYQNILWSVFRRRVIEDAFVSLNQCQYTTGNFPELTLGVEGLRNGKFYMSANGLNYRELFRGEHWGNTTPSISRENINKDPALRNDVDRFLRYYSDDGGFAASCLNLHLEAASQEGIGRLNRTLRSICMKVFNRVLNVRWGVYSDDTMASRIENAISN